MDVATISGVIIGLGMIILAILMKEGMKGVGNFINLEAIMIVIGGTAAALLVHFPLSRVIGIFKVLRKILTAKEEDTSLIITTLVEFAQRARREGFLSLENDVKNIENDFLKRSVQLVVDGQDRDFIKTMLETELGFIRERHKVGQEIFTALGTYCPALGIIGTILGMILMLRTLDDPSKVGGAMAVALVTAFYGLSGGYLLFYPMAGKLKRRSEEELLVKEIIIRGVLLLQAGASPRIIESNLQAYLEPAKRAELIANKREERDLGRGAGTGPGGSPGAGAR
jgi:chemotaxis protein MotA